MKVYHAGSPRGNHTVFVAPAADPRAIKAGLAPEWTNEAGEPVQMTVVFRGGEVEVPDALGKYLCATGIAKRTRLILPGMNRAA